MKIIIVVGLFFPQHKLRTMTITIEQLIQNNILIAEFMGCKKLDNGKYEVDEHPYEEHWQGNECDYAPEYMCYDARWEWIMPVVEKIESLKEDFINGNLLLESIGNHAKFIIDDGTRIFTDNIGGSKLEAIYNAVVQFINWYNENK